MRLLGIAAIEDKIVARAVIEVLNAIYETDFLGFSYGFRPGRQAHQALDALAVGIHRKKINWILDADIRGFFDAIDHDWAMKFLEHRISDPRMLRLIRKWLIAGVIEEGKWTASGMGAPQGASISPLLANIYLHYVLDLWAQRWRRKETRGELIIVRWADDFIVGFQYEDDARRFLAHLCGRLRKFSLELHPDKTRILRFGRFARQDGLSRDGRRKPETFDFLGFTHCSGTSRRGNFLLRRITVRKRLVAKLHEIKDQLRYRMHHRVADQGRWLRSVARGYYNYHAVPGNTKALEAFDSEITWLWYKNLRRRSQRNRLDWKRMAKIARTWLPPPRILHPWPSVRFDARIQGRSRMR